MPPNESGHDPAFPIVYLDYGAEDPTAVTRAFSAAFKYHVRGNEDELFARQAFFGGHRMARRPAGSEYGGCSDVVYAPGLLVLSLQLVLCAIAWACDWRSAPLDSFVLFFAMFITKMFFAGLGAGAFCFRALPGHREKPVLDSEESGRWMMNCVVVYLAIDAFRVA
ncbi:hypothetical protein Nepgr_020430 [Nepenthes gracilis]|uniref:Uncharacterized protein n=1 Tax=Nepenthes gracilis TaxID=150966 RepID=A0AAD3SXL5_NEPGR|nr:hypothetical protein Nepgr_020430 [Nepenthes gracilis]